MSGCFTFMEFHAHLERVGVLLRHALELTLEEDVALLDVAEEEGELGLVLRVCQGVLKDLPHGGTVDDMS
jgi:hypothetical protein